MRMSRYNPIPGRRLIGIENLDIKASKHCCKTMEEQSGQLNGVVFYDYVRRFHAFIIHNRDRIVQTLFVCPWCGKKLPDDLSERRYEELEKILGKDFDEDELSKIPEAFLSDTWWRERGL